MLPGYLDPGPIDPKLLHHAGDVLKHRKCKVCKGERMIVADIHGQRVAFCKLCGRHEPL